MPNQTHEQSKTISQLEFNRTQQIETILEEWMCKGGLIRQYKHATQALPYRSVCGDYVGMGDSRREADAQLAHKLSLSG